MTSHYFTSIFSRTWNGILTNHLSNFAKSKLDFLDIEKFLMQAEFFAQ